MEKGGKKEKENKTVGCRAANVEVVFVFGSPREGLGFGVN